MHRHFRSCSQTNYTFEPFGSTAIGGAGTTNSFAYTGRELDLTGLYFYRARYYDASIARFISEDPIRFSGGPNFYSYVGNNPIAYTDPLRLRVTWYGAFRNDDVPEEERPCYDDCTMHLDWMTPVAGIWGGLTTGIVAGIVLGSPFLGVGAVPGAVIGGLVGTAGGLWATYQTADFIDRDCKRQSRM